MQILNKSAIYTILMDSENDFNKRFLYQYWATFSGSISIVCTGMHFGWPSPSLPKLLEGNSSMSITSDDGSWTAAMPCIGAVSGSVLGVIIIDKIGRKLSMLITSPLYFISWILVAFSSSILMLNVARFLAGTADGLAFTAFPMYLGEIADPKIRGLLGTSISVSTVLGILLINIIGSYLSIKDAALVCSVVPILHFVTFIWMPESPYFYIIKEKENSARQSLIKFRKKSDVDKELNALISFVKTEWENKGGILDLFIIKSNQKALFLILCLRSAQQLTGTNIIMFYAQTIFKQTESGISANIACFIYFSIQLAVAIVSSVLVDRVGRRPLLLISIIGTACTLATEGLYFYLKENTQLDISTIHFLPLIVLFLYVIIFNLGMGTVPVMMLSELFPVNVKAFALCLADVTFGITVTIMSKVFQTMADNYGMYLPFFIFTIFSVVTLIFVAIFVPETKGKSLEEVQDYLRQKNFIKESYSSTALS